MFQSTTEVCRTRTWQTGCRILTWRLNLFCCCCCCEFCPSRICELIWCQSLSLHTLPSFSPKQSFVVVSRCYTSHHEENCIKCIIKIVSQKVLVALLFWAMGGQTLSRWASLLSKWPYRKPTWHSHDNVFKQFCYELFKDRDYSDNIFNGHFQPLSNGQW